MAESKPAYLIAQADVTDPAAYETYKRLAQDAIAAYGGRYLVRGGRAEILEGDPTPRRVVVVEFDSFEQAKRFYDSPEYRAARDARRTAAAMTMTLVEGI